MADSIGPRDPLHALLAGLAGGDDRVARWASQLLFQGEFTSSDVTGPPPQSTSPATKNDSRREQGGQGEMMPASHCSLGTKRMRNET